MHDLENMKQEVKECSRGPKCITAMIGLLTPPDTVFIHHLAALFSILPPDSTVVHTLPGFWFTVRCPR